jgi:hypothetical protein
LGMNGWTPVDNGGDGVKIDAAFRNIVGGTQTGLGNSISGNLGNGVHLTNGATQNTVVGNFIGTDTYGTIAVGNGPGIMYKGDGVLIDGASSYNTIGGLTGAAGNTISGNRFCGVEILASNNNYLQGNYIGTDITGTEQLGNTFFGVKISNSTGGGTCTGNVIGGTQDGAGNVISGNGFGSQGGSFGMGVYFAFGATGNFLQGNYIGTTPDGFQALGNRTDGVYLERGADNNTVGGAAASAGNVICSNGGFGVSAWSSGNLVQGNWIGWTKPDDEGNQFQLPNTRGWQDDQGQNNQWIDNDH